MKKIIGFFIIVAIVLYGAYEALMYYDNNFIYGRMRETPAVRPHEEPLFNMEAGTVPVSVGEAIYRATPGVDLKSPLDATDSVDHRQRQSRLPDILCPMPWLQLRW